MVRRGRPPVGPANGDGDMTPLSTEAELSLATKVARLYYLEDLSKVAIADQTGLSRFQVARLLQLARQSGAVHIEVGDPGAIDRELSASLQAAFGLRRALVVTSTALSPVKEIGRTLAGLLSEIVQPGDVVGLTWSRALSSMASQLERLQPCTVVQLAGHLTPAGDYLGSVEIVRRVAEVTQGVAYPIYAPMLVADEVTASSLRQQAEIAEAFAFFDRLDLAVVSVGAWAPSSSTIFDAVSEVERRLAGATGVVGEISGRLFDAGGRLVNDVLGDRVIGISLEQLMRTPEIVATSYGAYRGEATLVALQGGYITTLVADQSLARVLIGMRDAGLGRPESYDPQ